MRPPTTSTRPSRRSVAVWPLRGATSNPASVTDLSTGSNAMTLAVGTPSVVMPPTISVRPSGNVTAAPLGRGVPISPSDAHVPTAWGGCASITPDVTAAIANNANTTERRTCISFLDRRRAGRDISPARKSRRPARGKDDAAVELDGEVGCDRAPDAAARVTRRAAIRRSARCGNAAVGGDRMRSPRRRLVRSDNCLVRDALPRASSRTLAWPNVSSAKVHAPTARKA